MARPNKRVKLYLAEEQEILQVAYSSGLEGHTRIEMVGSSCDTRGDALTSAVKALSPDVVVVGTKVLHSEAVKTLEALREACPEVGMVLLSAAYDMHGVKALRAFSQGSSVGLAFLLKHTIDTAEQLAQVVLMVAEGRVVMDPKVMDSIITVGEASSSFLKELSPREMEVLGWMAKGYRNDTIAEVLSLDGKTVERHINNIYSKLNSSGESRHQRVQAVMLYLRGTGQLPPDQFFED